MQDLLFETFKTRVEELGLSITQIDEDGLITLSAEDQALQVSLDNVRKSYQQDPDTDHLEELISIIRSHIAGIDMPQWPIAQNNVYLNLFPANFDFADAIHVPVTNAFHRCFVYYNGDGLTWIDNAQLEKWAIRPNAFFAQVDANMRQLMNEATIQTSEVEGHPLAIIETEFDVMKAALLFSDNFKAKIEPVLGWPVCAVLPVRDSCYIFSEKDMDFFVARLGKIVLDEYNDAGYAVTTEILRFSSESIQAVGRYENQ